MRPLLYSDGLCVRLKKHMKIEENHGIHYALKKYLTSKLRITNYNINTISRKNTSSLTISKTPLIWSLIPAGERQNGSVLHISDIYKSIKEDNRNYLTSMEHKWLDWRMAYPIQFPQAANQSEHWAGRSMIHARIRSYASPTYKMHTLLVQVWFSLSYQNNS